MRDVPFETYEALCGIFRRYGAQFEEGDDVPVAYVDEVIRLLASPVQPGRSEAEALATVEDLDALPVGSVVLSRARDGKVWQKYDRRAWAADYVWLGAGNDFYTPTNWLAQQDVVVIHRAARVADTTTEGGE